MIPTVRCPTCNASPGQPCTTVAGASMGELIHITRQWRAERTRP
jgi:hypothetical protein